MLTLLPMTASLDLEAQALEEAAWVHQAALLGIATPADIVRWADAKIMAIDEPSLWLIELSTLKSRNLEEFAGLIGPELVEPLSTTAKISLIAAALEQGHIGFDKAVSNLNVTWILTAGSDREYEFGKLWDLVPELDQLDRDGPAWDDFSLRFRGALAIHLAANNFGPGRPFLISQPLPSC